MIDAKEVLKLVGQVLFATGAISLIGALIGGAVMVLTRPVPYLPDGQRERVVAYTIAGLLFAVPGLLILNATGW